MKLHVVTSASQEYLPDGRVVRGMVRMHGVFTDEAMANGASRRFDGTVLTIEADELSNGVKLATWINPGV
jgi:hypothetical protein